MSKHNINIHATIAKMSRIPINVAMFRLMRAGIWRAVSRSVHVRVEDLFSVTAPAVFLMRVAN